MKRIGRNLLSFVLLFVMGALSIVEICVEVLYQTVRLIKRQFGSAMDKLISKLAPLYKGTVTRFEYVPQDEGDIVVYEFNYEYDEEDES